VGVEVLVRGGIGGAIVVITDQWIGDQFPQLSEFARLAAGGQKFVFSAKHATDGDVVLKLIRPSGDGVERVQREILAVQRIASPRVPSIIEAGILTTPLGAFVWLRERRIHGESVRQALQRGPLPKDDVALLGLHMLEALADAERARIVHRDVKPDNIMRGSDGSFWLLDFGIARHLDLASLTATALPGGPGTVGYAPPEQYRNKKREIDVRADLFALGVTMIECLTGKNPFLQGARDVGDVIRRIEGIPLAVPLITGDAEGKLGDLIRAMAQRRLDCRPSSAADALQWMRETLTPSKP
jgi:serine/threonine protein kinase